MRISRVLPVVTSLCSLSLADGAPISGSQPQSQAVQSHAGEHVILLHGMCRTSRSMARLERALCDCGYTVHNVDYPSRSACVAELSQQVISRALAECDRRGATRIHFVTHSLGGILVRSYLSRHDLPKLGRVVMMGPPNQGSEVVDRIGSWRLFGLINGPSGRELGTGPDSVPNRLGPARFSVGVIAGNRSINWINSAFIAGPDDGKVSIKRTCLAGMADHVVVPTSHPFMMKNTQVIRQAITFLQWGKFTRS